MVIFPQTLELEDTSRPEFSLWLMAQSINDRYVINLWQSFFILKPLWKILTPELPSHMAALVLEGRGSVFVIGRTVPAPNTCKHKPDA